MLERIAKASKGSKSPLGQYMGPLGPRPPSPTTQAECPPGTVCACWLSSGIKTAVAVLLPGNTDSPLLRGQVSHCFAIRRAPPSTTHVPPPTPPSDPNLHPVNPPPHACPLRMLSLTRPGRHIPGNLTDKRQRVLSTCGRDIGSHGRRRLPPAPSTPALDLLLTLPGSGP